MRVLVLTHVFPRDEEDPSAPFLLDWARAVATAGVDLAVIAPHDAGLPTRHEVGGIPVLRVRYGPASRERVAYRGEMHQLVRRPAGALLVLSLVAALARAVRAQVRAGGPDLLHVHWWVPGAVVARLARPDVPVLLTVHGTDVALLESRPQLAPVARWALAGVDRVEAVSADLSERLARTTGRAPDAINPMPLSPTWLSNPVRSKPHAHGVLQLLAVGRMVPEKGFADLIGAVARLDRPARLTIIGDGPERDRLAAQAAACDVELRLPGRVPPTELRAAYAAADVVVQPSYREGFGLVAAEALAAGVPVVATDSGGARDILDDGSLVPPGDITALHDAIAAVASDLEAAAARAAAHQHAVRTRLSPEAAADRTVGAYRALLGWRQPATPSPPNHGR